jgi:hypothetical protein
MRLAIVPVFVQFVRNVFLVCPMPTPALQHRVWLAHGGAHRHLVQVVCA